MSTRARRAGACGAGARAAWRALATCGLVAGGLAACARGPVAAPAPAGALAAPVFVVRHAERAALPAGDPVLTDAGVTRAAALATRLDDVRLGGAVVTDRQRTRLTALPALVAQRVDTAAAARRLVVVPIGTDGAAAHAARVADSARALARRTGRAVLVVGHSNTVGPIVAALGGPDYGELCDTEYAWLFIVRPARAGVEPTRLTYGAPNPPADPACATRMRP